MKNKEIPTIARSDYSPTEYRHAMEKIGVVLSYTTGVSMKPLIWSGHHYVAVVPVDEPEIDDILLFEQVREGKTICILHRLVAKEGDTYITRGDNCLHCERIRREDILGKVVEIFRNGPDSPLFALHGKHITVQDKGYLRYVRIWNALLPVRRSLFKARRRAAKIGWLRKIYHIIKGRK